RDCRRVDDDIFTFNPAVAKYETRDISSFEIWDQYDSFEMFLDKEISTKLVPNWENMSISFIVRSKMKKDPLIRKNMLEYYKLMADGGKEDDDMDGNEEEEHNDDDGRYDAWV